jgi:hypothetical protein
MSNDEQYFENADENDVEDFKSFEEYYGFDSDEDEPKELEF